MPQSRQKKCVPTSWHVVGYIRTVPVSVDVEGDQAFCFVIRPRDSSKLGVKFEDVARIVLMGWEGPDRIEKLEDELLVFPSIEANVIELKGLFCLHGWGANFLQASTGSENMACIIKRIMGLCSVENLRNDDSGRKVELARYAK